MAATTATFAASSALAQSAQDKADNYANCHRGPAPINITGRA
jgi:hypothetical protein